MAEQLGSDLAISTLAADITNSASTLTITDASEFPGSGTFSIGIFATSTQEEPEELLTVTGVSGSTFTVTRGEGVTSGVAHVAGATVRQVQTARSLVAYFATQSDLSSHVAAVDPHTGYVLESALGTGVLTLLGGTPSGTDGPVGKTSPTLTTPNIGTPSAGTLTNCTGLPIAGLTGLGTNVGAALGQTLNAASGLVGFGGSAGALATTTLTATSLAVNGATIGSDALGVAGSVTITKTTEQLRLRYDATKYLALTVNSSGSPSYASTGPTHKFWTSTSNIRLDIDDSGLYHYYNGGVYVAHTVSSGGVYTIAPTGLVTSITGTLAATVSDAVTNAITNVVTIGHNTSGTAAAGFGSALKFQLETTTTVDTDAFMVSVEWATATHASRASRIKFNAYDTAVRECIRIEASGTVAMVGFFGAAAVVQQAGTGEATGFTAGSGTAVNDDSTFTGNVGSTAYRINDIVKALKNLGLLAQ